MPAFSKTRETVIAAPPEKVHGLIADFREWVRWSPWEERDPDLERSYTGEGVGSRYTWSGNAKAGAGSRTMTRVTPERIDIDLEFVKPFRSSSKVDFVLTPEGTGTRVAWTMSGRRNRAMAVAGKLFFDKSIGKDFETGLASLRAEAQRG